MNILILVSSLSYGGAEKQSILDAELLSREHTVYLGAFREGPLASEISPIVHFLPIDKKGYLFTAYNLAKIIKYKKIDIIHASLFAPMVISILATFNSRITVFWHFHSHEYDIPGKSKLAFRLLALSSSLKKILFVSQELQDYIEKRLNLPHKKLGLLYNCSQIQPTYMAINKKSFQTIGYVGRLVELKRVEYLIDLAAYLIGKGQIKCEILIIGDGESRSGLEQYARDLHVDRYITFTGFQSNPQKWYRKFDLFINPSREECLSMALIEAGMSGVPSLAFDVGGNREIIQSGVTGFIVSTKDALYTKSLLLLTNATLRDQMGRAAQEYCGKKFSAESHLNVLNALYKENVSIR